MQQELDVESGKGLLTTVRIGGNSWRKPKPTLGCSTAGGGEGGGGGEGEGEGGEGRILAPLNFWTLIRDYHYLTSYTEDVFPSALLSVSSGSQIGTTPRTRFVKSTLFQLHLSVNFEPLIQFANEQEVEWTLEMGELFLVQRRIEALSLGRPIHMLFTIRGIPDTRAQIWADWISSCRWQRG